MSLLAEELKVSVTVAALDAIRLITVLYNLAVVVKLLKGNGQKNPK